ncbi:dual oxidase maturation factor 1-like [Pollicipes pollicipes]|uniref:dual oxidase maturation factor 1-like n=1 Tax=Pollicipes pollicipes TaxID=41117 RepID=UPI001884D8A0|nr:dual oxidase maturation factor 1-like [Pollicipes pollicipes]
MGLYGASRIEGFASLFPSNKTPVTADVLEAGWIFAFAIIYISFLFVLPGYKGKRRWFVLIRVTCSCVVGLILMLGNFGMEWEVARLTTRAPYKAYTSTELDTAAVGMKVGLRGVNITLYVPEDDVPHELTGETINYNERFWWSWGQGRLGFGPFAGEIQREFRQAQYRGAPLPILWIAEYFTLDGEGIRFGRHYMRAGWYAHIVIWAAFPTYLMANIFYFMVLHYGAFFTLLTGLLQICGCVIWASVRNPVPLVIPFEDGALRTSYGVHFWLTLVNGLFCVLVGLVVGFLDFRYPDELADFFGIDPLQNYEEHYYTAEELKIETKKTAKEASPGNVELGEMPPATANDAENKQEAGHDQEVTRLLKRRTRLSVLQKTRRPDVAPRTRFMTQAGSIHE